MAWMKEQKNEKIEGKKRGERDRGRNAYGQSHARPPSTRTRMRDFTALPPSSPLATAATTNFLRHRLYPVILPPTPASFSLFHSPPPLPFRHILYHDFSHRLFFLRAENGDVRARIPVAR